MESTLKAARVNEFRNIAGHKINLQKLNLFSYAGT